MRIPLGIILCTYLLSQAGLATAADPLFADTKPLAITLTGPFNEINRKRDREQEYPGSLSYVDEQGQTVTLDAMLSVRGMFRLKKKTCSYAQLWVNLKKSQAKDTLFDKQDKLKLVVQCRNGDRYLEYLAREHQAYQIFNELSDLSYDTRLLNVTYVDSEKGDSRSDLGFFIQHQKRLAKEFDMEVLNEPRADKSRLDPNQATLVSMFNYMVSNTDYSLIAARPGENCCHNVKVLRAADGTLYPIPYDFDSTGYVSASYAEPTSDLGQRNVRQRMYRGYCTSPEAESFALEKLREKRDRVYAILSDTTYVSEKSVGKTRKYVDKFYEIIDDPKDLKREILEECR